jgi:hypothetical protein
MGMNYEATLLCYFLCQIFPLTPYLGSEVLTAVVRKSSIFCDNNAVQFIESQLTFQRNMFLQS